MGFPATFRTKCQIQVQVQGQARGALSLTRPPLFSGIIAPTSPPGRGPERTPAPPRRAQQEPPPPPAGAAPVPWSRRRRSVPPKDLGARAGVEGGGVPGGSGGAIRARGSLPNPAVPAANCAWSDGCPRGGVATGVPPPMTAVCRKLTWSWEARRRHVGLHLDKPQKDSSSEGPTNLRPAASL
ncbi:formin-like protein 20 [Rhinopithecus roxellana]|uniref:formin-like protein 20 n=1 Tax=Rhinopithecus roxellana TaxID=61622 RepID=UPI0012378845|nr:formin-like protein 20 [Rhinopithecus roxellana]